MEIKDYKMQAMKKKTLKTGQEVSVYAELYRLSINTRCPEKWLFLDLETGVFYTDKQVFKEVVKP